MGDLADAQRVLGRDNRSEKEATCVVSGNGTRSRYVDARTSRARGTADDTSAYAPSAVGAGNPNAGRPPERTPRADDQAARAAQ